MASTIRAIVTGADMAKSYMQLAEKMLKAPPFDRGEVHAQKTTTPEMVTREIRHVTQYFDVPNNPELWQAIIEPNLPWAEDHFLERVSGEPLNPPPSNEWWPFAQNGNAEHKKDEVFSHTYPERFWPRHAGHNYAWKPELDEPKDHHPDACVHRGIRFEYGDLNDIRQILKTNIRSRQAYLPIWFPEDTWAANEGERVPCTLGYHFQWNPEFEALDITYSMRSCDMVRFYRDDVYMAGRLLQWMCDWLNVETGEMVLHITNLHTFMGDQQFLEGVVQKYNPRAHYNFEALG